MLRSAWGWVGAVWAIALAAVMVIPSSGHAVVAAGLAAPGATYSPDLIIGPRVSPLGPTCSATALCPSAVRTAYNLTTLDANATTNGTGQTVVIVDACGDPSIVSDAKKFASGTHISAPKITLYYPQGTKVCSNFGWGLETALDVEWSHVVAPGASIALVVAAKPTSLDLYAAWNYSLSHHLGKQISNSWGGNGGCGATAKALLTSAAGQGVSILASAGDSGAWGSNQSVVAQSPADCRDIIAIGGTTLNVGTGGSYSSESGWSGSGGGYVPGSVEPGYQAKAKIADPLGEVGKPDVAAVADPNTGVWIYNSVFGWTTVGGTSVACPLWAAFLADANGWRSANGFGTLGNLLPYLYHSIYGVSGGSTHYASTIHDVKSGSNGWSAGAGWDAVTGVGSFNGYPLALLLGTTAAA